MTSSGRILNRVLLLLAGLLALAGAVLAALPLLPERLVAPWWPPVQRTIDDAVGTVSSWRIPWASPEGARIAAAAAGLILAIVLVVFLGTRRRRRARTVLRFADRSGSTAVDETIADAVLTAPLRRRGDVLSSHMQGYRISGTTALRLSVVPRAGADLPALLAEAERGVAGWDAVSGTRTPVVVHFADRDGFDRLRSATRTR
ncbi:hypothetical protein [Microbacterium sp. 13-71-7]|jgi:hypothetical protein|uniref:hypothetical protein n=1 Tax=Microbacterium sp. 13-71-7 TaxID=1970399 RepID=UPI000BD13082|nr:hypothetical protein [Microbacterium sp. 13-71-7]OZB84795.1 MAG: hypothetical protein B7X32_06060 [Microbacterium sp. 13-71-7]